MFNFVQHILLKHPVSSYLLFFQTLAIQDENIPCCTAPERIRGNSDRWRYKDQMKSQTRLAAQFYSVPWVNDTQEEKKCDGQCLQETRLLCCCIWKGMCQDLGEGERVVLNRSKWKSSQRNRFFVSKFLCDPGKGICSEFLHRLLYNS